MPGMVLSVFFSSTKNPICLHRLSSFDSSAMQGESYFSLHFPSDIYTLEKRPGKKQIEEKIVRKNESRTQREELFNMYNLHHFFLYVI